jgi:predicted lipoprotein with Yx(FWY)xxD motif
MRKLLSAGVLAFALLAAGCGGGSEGENATNVVNAGQSPTEIPGETPPMTPGETPMRTPIMTPGVPPTQPAQLEVRETDLGKILVGEQGRTVYLFTRDEAGQPPACTGECAQTWPPYLTEGEPEAGEGVNEDMLGTVEREDGTMQVTYNNHPLYYYIQDQEAGDTKGNGVEAFDGNWYAVTPEGKRVRQ